MVRVNHLLRRDAQVCDVAFDAGPAAGLLNKRKVDLPFVARDFQEPVPLDVCLLVDNLLRLRDRFVDVRQVERGPFLAILENLSAFCALAVDCDGLARLEDLAVLEIFVSRQVRLYFVRRLCEFRPDDVVVPETLENLDVPCGKHGGVSSDRDAGKTVALLETREHRDNCLDFSAVALEALDFEREARPVDQQSDRDLRLEPALFRKPRLPVFVVFLYLEIQRGHVVEDERQRGLGGSLKAYAADGVPVFVVDGPFQAAMDGRVGWCVKTQPVKDADRVELGGRLDDPREDELPENRVVYRVKPERVVYAVQHVP